MSAPGAAFPAPGESRQPQAPRSETLLWVFVGVTIVAALGMALQGRQPVPVIGGAAVALIFIAFQRTLLAWQTMLGLVLVIILFIPIRRYTVGGGLPIELEPYRVDHRGRARLLDRRAGRRSGRALEQDAASRRRSACS